MLAQEHDLLQDISIDFSILPPVKVKHLLYPELLQSDGQYAYIRYHFLSNINSKGEYQFLKINLQTGEKVWSAYFKRLPKYKGRVLKYQSAIVNENGETEVIYFAEDEPNDKTYVLKHHIDGQGIVSGLQLLYSFSSDGRNYDYRGIKWNSKLKRFLLVNSPKYSNEKNQRVLHMASFDIDGKVHWSIEIKLPYSYYSSSVVSSSLFASNKVILMAQVKEKNQDDGPDSKYVLYSIDPIKGEAKEVDLGLGEYWIGSMSIYRSVSDDNYLISGTYSRKDIDHSAGSFIIDMNSIDDSRNISFFIPYLDEIREYFLYQRGFRKNSKEIFGRFLLRGIHLTPDGNYLFVHELYQGPLPNGIPASFKDILVQKITLDGSVLWSAVIPKSMYYSQFSDMAKVSFQQIYKDGDLHLLYNDSKHNIDLWEGKTDMVMNVPSKGILAFVSIDKDGKMVYRNPHVENLAKKQLFLANIDQEGLINGEVMIWLSVGKKGKVYQIGRMFFR